MCKFKDAIDNLADQVESGYLLSSLNGGCDLLNAAADKIEQLEAENDSIKKWLYDKLDDYDFSDFVKDIEKSVLRIKRVKSERDKLKRAIEEARNLPNSFETFHQYAVILDRILQKALESK